MGYVLWFKVKKSRLRVSGFGVRGSCFGFRVSCFVFRSPGFVFRVSGFVVKVDFKDETHLNRLALDAPLLRAEGHHTRVFRPGFDQREALFRGGLVFKAHRLVYHSTLGWRVIKKKKKPSESIGSRQLPQFLGVAF